LKGVNTSLEAVQKFLYAYPSTLRYRRQPKELEEALRPYGLRVTWWGVILSEAKDLRRDPSAFRPQSDRKGKASGRPHPVFLRAVRPEGSLRGLSPEGSDETFRFPFGRHQKGRSFALLKIGERKEFFKQPMNVSC